MTTRHEVSLRLAVAACCERQQLRAVRQQSPLLIMTVSCCRHFLALPACDPIEFETYVPKVKDLLMLSEYN